MHYSATTEVNQCIQDPTVDVTWTKNGNSFATSEKIQVNHTIWKNERKLIFQLSENRKKLFILAADEIDSGQFVCTAKNAAGQDSATFVTTVNGIEF